MDLISAPSANALTWPGLTPIPDEDNGLAMFLSSLILGCVLAFIGVAGYFATGRKSVTALIPLFFGIPFALLGLLTEGDGLAGHVALVLALVGLVGTAQALTQLGSRRPATFAKAAMALCCLLFVGQWALTTLR